MGDRKERSTNSKYSVFLKEKDEHYEVQGFHRSYVKTGVTWALMVLSLGLVRLIFHWLPRWSLFATHSLCHVRQASHLLIVERYKKYTNYYVKKIKQLSADQITEDEEYSALKPGMSVSAAKDTSSVDGDGIQMENASATQEDHHRKTLTVPTADGKFIEVPSIRWFCLKKLMYIWDPELEVFYKLQGLDSGHSLSDLHRCQGLSWREEMRRRVVFGDNDIKVPITPLWKLLFLEALNPFYIFQVASVCLWFADNYIYYASVIVITSVLSIISEVYQMNKNQLKLRSTIQSSGFIEVVRENGESERVPSEHVVPGDVISIPARGCLMFCDAALLQGTAIVNESTLTGESVPVTKTPLLNKKHELFSEKEHSRHVLFCGTRIIQTRFYGNERVTAVVIRTGFSTVKGSLVRSILYPPPVDFQFQQDSYRFILVLVGIASFGFFYSVATKINEGLSGRQIMMDSLDLITIVVPPALPMAMTVGILYALQRLKRYKIFCISPRSINISGVLNCICFDKTGTLTEDGLDMKGVVEVTKNKLSGGKVTLEELHSLSTITYDHLLFGMATCHSITLIDMEMVGDPLDLKMFETTGWSLEEPGNDDTCKYDMIMPSVVRPPNKEDTSDQVKIEIGILRQFQFSSTLQRMSVITRKLGDPHFILYCKGSPEMIVSLSRPETVPQNFHDVLLSYTEKGFRVLAMGWRPLKLTYPKAHRIDREEVECELIFSGLLVLENQLKKETTPVITQLRNAEIRNIMVTGDNMLTALSVAKECGLIGQQEEVFTVKVFGKEGTPDQEVQFETTGKSQVNVVKNGNISLNLSNDNFRFAIEGKAWAALQRNFPHLATSLLVRGAVFARMNPDQKQQLVSDLQSLGYYVGMCGDGANDCGALKTAHAGVSLSNTEASVASPFTSKEPNISCVPSLIREGRTALVTSFGIFKYMATYSLTQFVSVMILYSIQSNLTDIQFLYIDLFLIALFAFFFGKTESYKGSLSATAPPSSLISVAPILSILLHMCIIISFQTFIFFYVQDQTWFIPFNTTNAEEFVGGYENYAVFSISQFQYIILAVVFAKGPPYRQPLYTNFLFSASVIVMTIFSVYLTIAPNDFLTDNFELVMPDHYDKSANFFRWQIVLFAIFNSILAFIAENFVIDYFVHEKLKDKFTDSQKQKRKYIAIEDAIRGEAKWGEIKPGKPLKIKNKSVGDNPCFVEANEKLHETQSQVKSAVLTQYQSSL